MNIAIRAATLSLLLSLAGTAGAEPTIDQIYQASKSGNLQTAQTMIKEVLKAHPESAKAHFVQAEIFSRAGNQTDARAELERAEHLKPGLGFAQPTAVGALRQALAHGKSSAPVAALLPATPAGSQFGGVPVLLLLGLGVVIVIWVVRRLSAANRPGFSGQSGGGYGPSAGFGGAPSGGPGAPYGGGGMGSGILGGLATGAAIGAGMVAGEALAHHLTDSGSRAHEGAYDTDEHNRSFDGADSNADLGGQDFGVSEAGSWDDDSASSSSWD